MKKTGFIDFLTFLQDKCALTNYLSAVWREKGAKEGLEALVEAKMFSPKVRALLYTTVFTWDNSVLGREYWAQIDKQWREYIDAPTEATAEEFLEIVTDGLMTIGR